MNNDFVDFTERYFGHDFQLLSKLDKEGYQWRIACWYSGLIEKGMFILLRLSDSDVRCAKIEDIESCGNPSDMYFLKIKIGGTKDFRKLFPNQELL